MKSEWSKHAHAQRLGILRIIRREQGSDVARRWNNDFAKAVNLLPPFPELGSEIDEDCFWTLPINHERLRQTLCSPYRIIYEHVEDEIHVLAIMDCAMLIRTRDTYWN